MADRTCEKCGKVFDLPCRLKSHLNRKTSCAPIVDREDLPDDKKGKDRCKYCGRTFSSYVSLRRHMRQNCKIANSEEGMEKLMEHTLRRQMERLEAQVTELTGLVKQQMTVGGAAAAAPTTLIQHQTNIGVQQTNVQVNATIIGFDCEDRIRIPLALVKAAFTENPRLVEYCRMTDDERTDADKAAPYVLEALVDLVRRAHKDPVYRNIYLNPKRADQVMVCVKEKEEPQEKNAAQRWEVRSLVDAIRLLFDGVADNLHRIIITDQERTQLPFDIQSAASWVPNLYEDEPDRFVKDGRAPMAAHLANTRPAP